MLSSCSETIYQQVPSSEPITDENTPSLLAEQREPSGALGMPTNTAGPGTSDSSNESNSLLSDDSNQVAISSNGNTTTIEDTLTGVTQQTTDNDTPEITPAVIGEQGEVVDCDSLLPCRWVSTGGDFSLTVGDVDNTGTLGGLVVRYTIEASHDSELILGNGSAASDGDSFTLVQQSLGLSNGVTPQALLAGQSIIGSATYERSSTASSLEYWTLTVIDNGLSREIEFKNLPIALSHSSVVDCESTLPCDWQSSNKNVTLTLLSVGGYQANGRLNVNFSMVTDQDMEIVLDAGAIAIAENQLQLEGRTHSLGLESGFAEINVSAKRGVMLPGNVSFFRTPQPATSLQSLTLIIYQDIPTPRWNPRFINLPTN